MVFKRKNQTRVQTTVVDMDSAECNNIMIFVVLNCEDNAHVDMFQ